MSLQPKKVGIVVDRTFGDRLLSLLRLFHVWVVESADNLPAIQSAWTSQSATTNSAPTAAVTSFKALEGESPDDMCARIAGDVDEHHGELAQDRAWREIEIFGVSLNRRLRSVFEELGANTFEPTKGGFICRRSSIPADPDAHQLAGPD